VRHFTPSKHTIDAFRSLAIVILFAGIAVATASVIKAATVAVPVEAETGIISANASQTHDVTASGQDSVLFGGADTPLPNPSVTGPITSPTFGGKCLDIENGVASPNSAIRIWPCNGAPAQQWTVAFANDGSSEIHALGLDQCLATRQSGGQTVLFLPLELEPCSNLAKQRWLITRTGTWVLNAGLTTLNNKDICMAIDDLHPVDGSLVGAKSCSVDIGAYLTWSFPSGASYAGIGPAHFKSNTAKCLDLPSGSTAAGIQLQVWDCNDQASQKFTLGHDGTGRVKIVVLGQCVEAKDGGTADGTLVQINTCSGSTAQNWQVDGTTDASFKNMKSGKCIDTESGTVANSALMVIKTCSSSAPGQHFQ
jgi:hypothetical protein